MCCLMELLTCQSDVYADAVFRIWLVTSQALKSYPITGIIREGLQLAAPTLGLRLRSYLPHTFLQAAFQRTISNHAATLSFKG